MRITRKQVSETMKICLRPRKLIACGELWHIFHDELDLDGNGHLGTDELATALRKAGESSTS